MSPFVCMCVFVGRVLGVICVGAWMTVIRVWERGRRAILQRGEAKRVASRNLVSRLSVIPFLSPCACCPVIRLIKATYRQRRHVHATVLTHVENKLSLMYGLKPAEKSCSSHSPMQEKVSSRETQFWVDVWPIKWLVFKCKRTLSRVITVKIHWVDSNLYSIGERQRHRMHLKYPGGIFITSSVWESICTGKRTGVLCRRRL